MTKHIPSQISMANKACEIWKCHYKVPCMILVSFRWFVSESAFNSLYNMAVIMSAMASQITSLAILYSTVYSGADQRNHQSSASLAFVRGIHRLPVNSHKWPVTRKRFPFDDVILYNLKQHLIIATYCRYWLVTLWGLAVLKDHWSCPLGHCHVNNAGGMACTAWYGFNLCHNGSLNALTTGIIWDTLPWWSTDTNYVLQVTGNARLTTHFMYLETQID